MKDVNSRQILPITTRAAFRAWLTENHATVAECFVLCQRGDPAKCEGLAYLDAVEEALCFGWIDSTVTRIDGITVQRFAPRTKKSHWTELNKERVRRLERLGLMTDAGRAVLPPMGPRSFRVDAETEAALKAVRAWAGFRRLPLLYQRVRASNLLFYREHVSEGYQRMLQHTIETAKDGKTFGEWNDYGRLTDEEPERR